MASFWIGVWAVEYPTSRLEPKEVASLRILDSRGQALRQEMSAAGFRETWVPLDQISSHLVGATLASEDSDFHDHNGVDWLAMGRAVWLNLKHRRFSFGGSTLTMQLVRLTLGTKRTLPGKLHQILLSVDLEQKVTKEEILEQYLNRVYYGNGAWGAEQAARFYFDKRSLDLSLAEAATLAVIPRGPKRYDPFRHYERTEARRNRILDLMVKKGYIDDTTRSIAKRAPLRIGGNPENFRAPHFVQFVKTRLPEEFSKGAQVRTTLDYHLQQRLEIAVARHVDKLSWRNLTQASVVIIRNSDGAILAMVGSRDYADHEALGANNGATARLRPGSTLKPFVYATAIEAGDSAASIAYDVILPNDANQFYTKDVRSHGFARYRESLAGSYNLSAVHTLQRVGIRAVLEKLRRAGLDTLSRPDEEYDWGLAIGHADVRLIDLTAAFSTFGRGGRPVVPRAIARATRVDGETYSEEVSQRDPVFTREISYILFDILSDPDARRPMFGMSVPMNLPFKVALKTGTTKAYTDVWALGTTREYTVGVWGGNFKGEPTHRVKSVQGATPLLRAAFVAIAARYGDPTAPKRPGAVVSANICPLSGKAPGPNCGHVKKELFVRGNTPKESCDWHQSVCGAPAVIYPKELRSWTRFFDRTEHRTCIEDSGEPQLRIVAPVEGAHFVLEPHRPARLQKPPLSALPVGAEVAFSINGTPADQWIPTPGRHTVEAVLGDHRDRVTIVYE